MDPLGYFSPLFPELGWRPRGCGGASPEASQLCDRYAASCGFGLDADLYSRDACLTLVDDLEAEGRGCAADLLTEAEMGSRSHCTYFARGVCGP